MVSPAPRTALVLGKAISSAARGLSQAMIVYALAVLMGIKIDFAALNILGVAPSSPSVPACSRPSRS
jgi:ABC-2 type transport system permease protein